MTVPTTPLLTVDAVIILNRKIVLIKRKNPPFKNNFALPGGFVEVGETTEAAVIREANEETGLSIDIIKLVGVYSEPSRDPRGHTVSVCYLAIGHGEPRAATDAAGVALFDIKELPDIAFDHQKMIDDAGDDINGILSKM
ncbi:NUDIX hydrolase [Methanococcoides methylutens]|uniref:NUDIX domain-containing protein n=1 Tax=Methanococcoides methylutens TaxID=2226 RepID=UPI00064F526B|nr:NUDIX hydrolase [Methanococcoides methylutens]